MREGVNYKLELKLGKMTTKELANWFGITAASYNNSRTKKLEELRWYCDFDIVYGGIKVKVIRHSKYIKNNSRIGKEIRDILPQVWRIGEPHTCVQVGAKIYELKKQPGDQISTYIYQTRKQRTMLVGKPSPDNPYCHYALVKGYRGDNEADTHFELLTPAEQEIQKEILQSYFREDVDLSLVFDLYADGRTEEAMQTVVSQAGWTSAKYKAYLQELTLRLKCDYITRGTVIIEYPTENPNNWSIDDDIQNDDWLSMEVE